MARRTLRLLALAAIAAVIVVVLQRRSRPAATPVPAPSPTPAPSTPSPAPAPPVDPAPVWLPPVDGACPPGYPVKVNDSSGIFHVPGGRFYQRTIPDRCYATTGDALAGGYRQAKA